MRLVWLALASLVLAGCAAPAAPPSDGESPAGTTPPAGATPSPTPAAPEKGPNWSFTATDGATYSRDSPDGNASVLFFMATWCSSCRTLAPKMANLHGEYADKDVRFFSLDFDPSERKEDIERWQRDRGQDWPHGIDEDLRLQRTFNVRTQSTVVVLDGQGNVVLRSGYGPSESQIRSAIDDALARA